MSHKFLYNPSLQFSTYITHLKYSTIQPLFCFTIHISINSECGRCFHNILLINTIFYLFRFHVVCHCWTEILGGKYEGKCCWEN
jgi:hypothetical protein